MQKLRWFPVLIMVGCTVFMVLLIPVLFTGRLKGAEGSLRSSIDQYNQSMQLRDEVKQLNTRAEELNHRLNALQTQISDNESQAKALSSDLATAGAANGNTALAGQGVVVRLADTPQKRIEEAGPYYDINWFLVHDHDLLTVVNLLKAAGAEAVSINGVRLQTGTAIHCGGPTIYVHDISLTPPFEIAAIGDSNLLSDAIVKGNGGQPSEIYQELTSFGIIFEIEKKSDIMIPSGNTADAAENASKS